MRIILTATILPLIAVAWLPTPARCNQPVATFLIRYCTECHGPSEIETSLAVHELAGEFKAEKADTNSGFAGQHIEDGDFKVPDDIPERHWEEWPAKR